MRTTVRLDDDLLRELKKRAERANVSMSSLMNQALRQGLADGAKSPAKPYREKTYDMGEPLTDITKALSIAFAMEDEEMIRKMKLGQ